MATHSSTLAWKIPWAEEPGRLQSMGLRRVGHNWATSLSLSLSCIGEGDGNPLQCSCLENPRGRGAWWAAVYGVVQRRTWLKQLSSSSSRSRVILLSIQRETAWAWTAALLEMKGMLGWQERWWLTKASKSSTISASWEMCPRVNGKAVRGRSHPFSVFRRFPTATVTKLAGHGWGSLRGFRPFQCS